MILVLVFDCSNGFHDSANMIATVIASRAMSPVTAVTIVSVFGFLGPLLGGTAVANTIGHFVHLDDVVSAIILALGKPVNSRINISGGKEISLLQLYESVAKVMNSSVKPVLRDPVLGDILRSCLSNGRAKSMLGWSPKIDLATGLKMSLIESVKTN